MLKVTTSWDDGDVLDKRLAHLLEQYDCKGTFYISKCYRSNRLSEEDIRYIAKKHEIGAHTLTHPDLRALTQKTMKEEINGSKQWLEEVLGSEIEMFCYPKGLYNATVVEIVKAAGFRGARTTNLGSIADSSDLYLLDTTMQVYPFPFRKISGNKYYVGKILEPYTQRAQTLRALGVPITSMYSWISMAKKTFDVALRSGKVFHLWGHSWEIEKYEMWDELEMFLDYIGRRKDCTYATNGDLVS